MLNRVDGPCVVGGEGRRPEAGGRCVVSLGDRIDLRIVGRHQHAIDAPGLTGETDGALDQCLAVDPIEILLGHTL